MITDKRLIDTLKMLYLKIVSSISPSGLFTFFLFLLNKLHFPFLELILAYLMKNEREKKSIVV